MRKQNSPVALHQKQNKILFNFKKTSKGKAKKLVFPFLFWLKLIRFGIQQKINLKILINFT